MTLPLHIQQLSKTFAGQQVLQSVELQVRAGEVHALLGQNGSGKSTLVKILAGYHEPDPGAHASVAGESFRLGDASAARAAGLRFVHQDLGLVDVASTVENLALGRGFETGLGKRIRWREQTRVAREAVTALGLDIDVTAPVGQLDAADRTGVAIARALIDADSGDGVRLLVLDEPTAALPVGDVHRLFDVVRRLSDRGVPVLFVSHHLDEVFAIADRVTVLRDGVRIDTVETSTLDHDGLVELIVGRRVDGGSAAARPPATTPIALDVAGLAGERLESLSFALREGEVLGVAGLRGSGREEVAGLLAGRLPRDGDVTLAGTPIPNYDPRSAVEAGMFLVPGDRAAQGVVAEMSVRENLSLSDVRRFMHGGRLRNAEERAETREWIERLRIVTAGSEAGILTLSGGNQQKVLIARALRITPRVLLLDDPTKGVDIGAKDEIHALIEQITGEGTAVLLASTDAEELVRLCHRVVVLEQGRVADVLEGPERLTDEHIQRAQMGAAA